MTSSEVSSRLSDSKLVTLLRHEPDAGLQTLMVERRYVLRRAIRRAGIASFSTTAEEIEAQFIVVVWLRVHDFDLSRAPLDAWLTGIVRRIILERRRSTEPDGHHVCACTLDVPFSCSSRPGLTPFRVRRLIRHMPHRERIICEMDLADPCGRASTAELQAQYGGSKNQWYQARRRAHARIKSHRHRFRLRD